MPNKLLLSEKLFIGFVPNCNSIIKLEYNTLFKVNDNIINFYINITEDE